MMLKFVSRSTGASDSTSKPVRDHSGIAIFVTFMTLGNGLISLVNGIQWFTAGGSIIPRLDIVETGVGAIILGMSLLMASVLFTKLKVYLFLARRWLTDRDQELRSA
jgi:hypothetical protein